MLPRVQIPLIGHEVSTYGIVLTVYVYIALLLTIRLNAHYGIDSRTTVTTFAVGIVAGIVGARLLDMLEYPSRYSTLASVLGRNGSSIYGALIAAFLVASAYSAARGIPPLTLLDAGAPAMALGEAMSRLGCFLNGCCYGIPWRGKLAVTFPPESFAFRDQVARGLLPSNAAYSLPVHPVQLYSACLALIGFLYLVSRHRQPHRTGQIFFAFLIFYGVLRLLMAPLRVEALPTMTVFSLVFILVGTLGIVAAQVAGTRVATVPVLPND